MFERFSDGARRALSSAQEEARLLRNRQIGAEHLLLGLLHDPDSVAGRALGSLGVTLEAARSLIGATPSDRAVDLPPFTGTAKRALEHAARVSVTSHDARVTTRHLLLGLLEVDDASPTRLFEAVGATAPQVRSALDALPGGDPDPPRRRARPRTFAVGPVGDVVDPGAMGTEPAGAPPPPDLPPALVADLEHRYGQLPVHRIRRDADLWALRRVEEEHLERLARQHQLDDVTRDAALDWWLGRVHGRCSGARTRIRRQEQLRLHRVARRRSIRPNAVFQLYWNTVGPGGRTWFGNRYATIRRHTFRIRWRP